MGRDLFPLLSKGEGLVSRGEGLVSAGFRMGRKVLAGFVWEGLVSGGLGSFRFLPLIHRSHLQLKTFKLQQTEMACLMVSETKLIVNHYSFGSYKTKQVKSSINCLPLCSMRTIRLQRL